jgi:hypothetical protein
MESIEDIEAVRRFEALEQKRQERIVRENRIKEKVSDYNSEKMILYPAVSSWLCLVGEYTARGIPKAYDNVPAKRCIKRS